MRLNLESSLVRGQRTLRRFFIFEKSPSKCQVIFCERSTFTGKCDVSRRWVLSRNWCDCSMFATKSENQRTAVDCNAFFSGKRSFCSKGSPIHTDFEGIGYVLSCERFCPDCTPPQLARYEHLVCVFVPPYLNFWAGFFFFHDRTEEGFHSFKNLSPFFIFFNFNNFVHKLPSLVLCPTLPNSTNSLPSNAGWRWMGTCDRLEIRATWYFQSPFWYSILLDICLSCLCSNMGWFFWGEESFYWI